MSAPLPSWRYPDRPTAGSFEGAAHGSDVSFFVVDAAPGEGPALHRHPYSETFVLQAGRARFRLGEESIDAAAGEVVVVPPETAHGFRALGPERLRLVSVHAAPRMQTTWLDEEPRA
jgi:mannose-6-phosphate isomerase-like protein (cupin superfamily)